MHLDQPRQDGFARHRRLQERARRQHKLGAADPNDGQGALRDDVAMARQPCKISTVGDLGERGHVCRRQRA